MIWQDVVISVGNVIFILALLPTIFGESKPDWRSSLTTSTVACVFAVTFLTLGMWFSALAAFVLALAWAVLLFQAKTIKVS